MRYDSSAPQQLKEIQEWFGCIIARPIDEESAMNPISPSGNPMEEEAARYIIPSPTLRAAQRIEIYNQQYWWRLASALHENLPLVTRLFGYHEFNHKLAAPYLVKYPSNDWSLSTISDRFPQWIEEEYFEDDRNLILNASRIDCAYVQSFLSAPGNPITLDMCQEDRKLILQPHLHLFLLPYNLIQFRMHFLLKDVEHWIEHDFPPLEHHEHETPYILFRNKQNQIEWGTISNSEFKLLSLFRKGISIEELCDFLESQDPKSDLYHEASQQLGYWIQHWVAANWIGAAVYDADCQIEEL